jgi:uncharacterized protein
MSGASCIYSGWVMHRRLKPRRHRFRYRAWWLLLDIDELPQLSARLRWLSHGRFNLFAFHDADFGHDTAPLRQQVERQLAESGIAFDGGAIRLLCMPRVLGYAFNPLSIFFCYGRAGEITAIVYEVHNTFGERHSYVMAAAPGESDVVRQATKKRFHVSPFMDMDMGYEFRVTHPADTISVGISGSDAAGPLIHATLQARRRELCDAQLLRLLITHPLVTLKVIGAIHWEALRLLAKRVRPRAYPGPPAAAITAVAPSQNAKGSHA